MAVSTAEAQPRFLNRELSQLDFNGRVLEIVRDDSRAAARAVNFCAIFSSNMDEFFMVRVAGLMDQVAAGVAVRSPDGLTPQAALAEIRERTTALAAEQAKLWKRHLQAGPRGAGDRRRRDRGPRAGGAGGARARLRQRDLPGADAARGRARASRSRTSRGSRSASASSSAMPRPARSASRA